MIEQGQGLYRSRNTTLKNTANKKLYVSREHACVYVRRHTVFV